jgi:hypothetical protein
MDFLFRSNSQCATTLIFGIPYSFIYRCEAGLAPTVSPPVPAGWSGWLNATVNQERKDSLPTKLPTRSSNTWTMCSTSKDLNVTAWMIVLGN